MKTVLVTGVNGFVGGHVVDELVARGCEVVGVRRHAVRPELRRKLLACFSCDLTDAEAVAKLDLAGIDAVINLAGLAKVGDSFAQPEKYKHTNVDVLAVLCEHLIKERLQPRVIAISSGAVYDSNQAMPFTEEDKLASTGSPYAMSKIEMEKAAQAFRKRGLDCVIARPFNHCGPGQQTGFLIPDLYQTIKSAQKRGGALKVGNLATKRDYTDVRDVARAYADLALAKELHHHVYNICSGKSVAGKEILRLLLQETGAHKWLRVVADPELLRPNDAPELYGSYAWLKAETGWTPHIPLRRTVKDFVADLNR